MTRGTTGTNIDNITSEYWARWRLFLVGLFVRGKVKEGNWEADFKGILLKDLLDKARYKVFP